MSNWSGSTQFPQKSPLATFTKSSTKNLHKRGALKMTATKVVYKIFFPSVRKSQVQRKV
jgi:hypothetical protein